MKSHEKKAIMRALVWLTAVPYDKTFKMTTRRELALEAVELAQLRARRKYDRETYTEAVEYGIEVISGGK